MGPLLVCSHFLFWHTKFVIFIQTIQIIAVTCQWITQTDALQIVKFQFCCVHLQMFFVRCSSSECVLCRVVLVLSSYLMANFEHAQNCTADQRLCFCFTDSKMPLLSKSFCGCTAWFVLDLTVNPKDRFLCVTAHKYCYDLVRAIR